MIRPYISKAYFYLFQRFNCFTCTETKLKQNSLETVRYNFVSVLFKFYFDDLFVQMN